MHIVLSSSNHTSVSDIFSRINNRAPLMPLCLGISTVWIADKLAKQGVSEMPHRNIYCLRLDLFCSMLDVVWSVWSLVTVMQKSCVWSPLWSRVCSPYVAPHTSQLRIFVTLAPAVTLSYIAYFTRLGGLAWHVLRLRQLEAGSYIKQQEVPIIQLLHYFYAGWHNLWGYRWT